MARGAMLPSEFDRIADLFFSSWAGGGSRFAANVQETDSAYVLSAAVGIPKEDIHVTINGNLITIQAEHEVSFAIPEDVARERIETHVDSELLEVFLPKLGDH